MTPQQFIAKWRPVELTERSACQQHFLDLCDLLGQEKPAAADPQGAWYTFERGVRKTEGGHGWADVWMRGHFGWECTLTNLYNQRPTWLELAHLELDRAVLAAYGWPEDWAERLQPNRDKAGKVNPILGVADLSTEQEVLASLLALNRLDSSNVPNTR